MRLLPLAMLLFVAACASQPARTPAARPAPAAPPPVAGMERLLGQTAEAAIGLLGTPSLDRREGPARQLQFAGACILDIFYYPQPGTQPVATFAEARLSNGRDLPAGECLRQLLSARRR